MLEYGAYSPALSTILCKCKRDSVISSLISEFCFGIIKYFALTGRRNVEDILNPGRCPGLGDRRPSALGCAVMQNRNSLFINYNSSLITCNL